jgi:ribosomal protein S18 acetylase RimI-like enzyme
VAGDVHQLIYVRAGWAEVPGHNDRDLAEWTSLFAGSFLVPGQQILAKDGDELVGAAMCRIWDDGTGWVSQLAVDRAHRGRGIGRALLLTALRTLRDDGATSLGLSVNAENRGALGLYRSVGLTVSREWLTYAVGVPDAQLTR